MWSPLNGTGYSVPGLGMNTSVIAVMYYMRQL
jgi:hypothetical protein